MLEGRRALVTGGDSGIGRSVAVAFAKEGADVAVAYLREHDDARRTCRLVEGTGRMCTSLPGDLGVEKHCVEAVERTVTDLGGLDILVNNVAVQEPQDGLEKVSSDQWERTFRTNVHSFSWTTKAALGHLPDGGAIINTASVNGLRGNRSLIDYSATKGAVIAFTYAPAQSLVDRRIRVNGVAPGPVWTPLIPATFPPERVQGFGQQVPMQRAAHPDEIAPSYVFLASECLSSYYTGEVLAPLGGETTPGRGARAPLSRRDDRHARRPSRRRVVGAGLTFLGARGAHVRCGGEVPAGVGALYPATVLEGCTDDMAVMREETFGPVAPVRVVASFEEALAAAAGSRYGLAATVLTRSMVHAQRAWRELPVGTVTVNTVSGGAPGGSAEPRRASGRGVGYGRELLDEMTAPKVIHIGTAPG